MNFEALFKDIDIKKIINRDFDWLEPNEQIARIIMYIEGYGLNKDYKEAINRIKEEKHFEFFSDEGVELGEIYHISDEFLEYAKDRSKYAMEYYELKKVKNGSPFDLAEAYKKIGKWYLACEVLLEVDKNKAFEYISGLNNKEIVKQCGIKVVDGYLGFLMETNKEKEANDLFHKLVIFYENNKNLPGFAEILSNYNNIFKCCSFALKWNNISGLTFLGDALEQNGYNAIKYFEHGAQFLVKPNYYHLEPNVDCDMANYMMSIAEECAIRVQLKYEYNGESDKAKEIENRRLNPYGYRNPLNINKIPFKLEIFGGGHYEIRSEVMEGGPFDLYITLKLSDIINVKTNNEVKIETSYLETSLDGFDSFYMTIKPEIKNELSYEQVNTLFDFIQSELEKKYSLKSLLGFE